jgi:hypothetical protein
MACRIEEEIAAAAAMPLPDEDEELMDWADLSKMLSGCHSLVLGLVGSFKRDINLRLRISQL